MNKKIIATIIVGLHILICSLSGALGWIPQFWIVSMTTLISILICYNKYHTGSFIPFFIPLPFLLGYGATSILLASYQTYPIWISGILIVVLSYVFLKLRFNMWRIFIISQIIILPATIWIMPNYLAGLNNTPGSDKYSLRDLTIVDEKNRAVNLVERKNKILIIDVWFTTCGPCIKQFPELEKLKEKLKGNSDIEIISLNLPLADTADRKRALELTKPYTFEKLFFTSPDEIKKLAIKSFPVIIVFDKQSRCVYAGDLLLNSTIYRDNIFSIINSIKQKE